MIGSYTKDNDLFSCRVYIYSQKERSALMDELEEKIGAKKERYWTLQTGDLDIDLDKHDAYDAEKADPLDLDTYMYYPYLLDVGPLDNSVDAEYFIQRVKELLEFLKKNQFSPALSADFEQEIPGY